MRKSTYAIVCAFLMLMTFISESKAQCGFSFSYNVTPPSCVGLCDGSITVTVTGGTGPLGYDWNGAASPAGDGTATITGLCDGVYTVMVTDMGAGGCFEFGNTSAIAEMPPTPSICMATCDASSTNNIVYWDKTAYNNVDSFYVYREVVPGGYARIAAVSNDSLSEFVDTSRHVGPANGDPDLAAYKYKLQILDNCGNLSAMSPYHRTIHIEDSGAGEFSWALRYEIEGAPNPVTNYILLCDTLGVDVWGPVAVVSSTDTTAVDPGFASHPTIANWRVKTNWPIVCTSTRATVNTTRSNIKNGMTTTGIAGPNLMNLVLIYPNPAADEITIQLSDAFSTAVISIYNLTGQLVYQTSVAGPQGAVGTKRIDTRGFASGMYTVQIENNTQIVHKKLVVK